MVYDFERTVCPNLTKSAREITAPMEYFRIHAKTWLFWEVLGIGPIIAPSLGCQIIDSTFTPSEVRLGPL